MHRQLSLRRRLILQGLAVGGLSVATATRNGLALGNHRVSPPQSMDSVVKKLLTRKRSAARIGKGYLRVRPQDAGKRRLTQLVFEGFPTEEAMDIRKASHWIADRVANDFRTGKSVVVDGWVLAETEARLCALSCFL